MMSKGLVLNQFKKISIRLINLKQPISFVHNTKNLQYYSKKRFINTVSNLKVTSKQKENDLHTDYPIDLSHVKGKVLPPLSIQTVGDLFDSQVTKYGDLPALISVHENIEWSYNQFSDEVNKLVRGLLKLDIKKGDRIGIYMPNGSSWITLQYATSKLGIILVTLNPAYRSKELSQALQLVGINYIVTVPCYKGSDYQSILKSIIPELNLAKDLNWKSNKFEHLKGIIMVDDLIKDQPKVELLPSIINYNSLLLLPNKKLDQLANEIQSTLDQDDVINVQFTSGTTGLPKGVALTHRNLVNNGYGVGMNQKLKSGEIVCIPVPLYHCFGLVLGNLACLNHGSAVLYPSPTFEPNKSLRAVEKYKANALYGVPTMFIAMLDLPNFDKFNLTSLRTGIMAGSPCPIEIMKKVISLMNMKEVTICYGMTETSPVSFQSLPTDPSHLRSETVGKIMPHVQCKVVDQFDRSKILKPNQKGRLMTKGYLVMKGYWDNQKDTDEIIDEDGWLDTGDLATIDSQGYCRIVGRAKDMIIRGGENIYPVELENYLFSHPSLTNIAIIGVPDKKFGEQVCACYTPNNQLNQEELDDLEAILRDYCKEGLAHFKVPKYWIELDKFPQTVTGKIMKFELRELAVKKLGL